MPILEKTRLWPTGGVDKILMTSGGKISFNAPCCCCYEFTDNFNRTDSTNVGSDWTEVSGDWEIASNTLYEPGTAGAKLISTNQVPASSEGECHVQATFVNASAGMIYRLFAAVDDDGNNGWSSEHEKLDSTPGGQWVTRLYFNGVLRDTSVNQSPFAMPDTDHVVGWLCCDNNGNAKAGVLAGQEYAWVVEDSISSHRYFGVGHQNSGGTYFDNFTGEELRRPERPCYECWCSCCANFLQRTLKATITNATGRADCLDGHDVDLVWDWDGGLQDWKGTLTAHGQTFALRISCSGSAMDCNGNNISLGMISNCAKVGSAICGSLSTECILSPGEGSVCDPLYLIFGPYEINDSMIACQACYPTTLPPTGPATGSYYIVVTEPA